MFININYDTSPIHFRLNKICGKQKQFVEGQIIPHFHENFVENFITGMQLFPQ